MTTTVLTLVSIGCLMAAVYYYVRSMRSFGIARPKYAWVGFCFNLAIFVGLGYHVLLANLTLLMLLMGMGYGLCCPPSGHPYPTPQKASVRRNI